MGTLSFLCIAAAILIATVAACPAGQARLTVVGYQFQSDDGDLLSRGDYRVRLSNGIRNVAVEIDGPERELININLVNDQGCRPLNQNTFLTVTIEEEDPEVCAFGSCLGGWDTKFTQLIAAPPFDGHCAGASQACSYEVSGSGERFLYRWYWTQFSCDAGDVASLTNAVKSNVVASHGAAYNPTWTCAAGFAGGPFTIRTTCAHGTVRQPPTGAACIPITCTAPGVANSNHPQASSIDYNTRQSYTCDTNYRPTSPGSLGGESFNSGACTSVGSVSVISCARVTCESTDSQHHPNAAVQVSAGAPILAGQQYLWQCNAGFGVGGTSLRAYRAVCNANGFFPSTQSCQPLAPTRAPQSSVPTMAPQTAAGGSCSLNSHCASGSCKPQRPPAPAQAVCCAVNSPGCLYCANNTGAFAGICHECDQGHMMDVNTGHCVQVPTQPPSQRPTAAPATSTPSRVPSTSYPTVLPSSTPSRIPSMSPTSASPTTSPTTSPTMGPTMSPTSTPSGSPTTFASALAATANDSSSSSSIGLIIGIVLAVLALLVVVAIVAWKKSSETKKLPVEAGNRGFDNPLYSGEIKGGANPIFAATTAEGIEYGIPVESSSVYNVLAGINEEPVYDTALTRAHEASTVHYVSGNTMYDIPISPRNGEYMDVTPGPNLDYAKLNQEYPDSSA